MAIPDWPMTVPHNAVGGSWTINSLNLAPIASDMNGGNVRQRRAPGGNVAIVTQTIRMTRDELQTFKLFVRDTLSGGVSRFTTKVWLGEGCETKECQFVAQPAVQSFGSKVFAVSMQLRVYGM